MSQLIKKSDVLSISYEIAEKVGLPKDKYHLISLAIQSINSYKVRGEKEPYYAWDELKDFMRNFMKWIEEQDVMLLRRKRGWKIDKVPDALEIVESKQYLGLRGSLYPAVKQAIWEIWEEGTNYVEVLLTGGIGTGKSFLLELCLAIILVRLSLLHDPQAELDLGPGQPLYIVMQAGNLKQANRILFKPFRNRLKRTQYFTKTFAFRKDVTSELIFPNEVYVTPFSGSDDDVLGLTVVGAGVTELNRMDYVTKSKRGKREDDFAYDQAVSIYKTLIKRMVSRTLQYGGGIWGKLVLDAARESSDDFTSKKMAEAEERPDRIYVYDKKQWEVVPQDRFGEETFLVEVGDERRRSRIIVDREQAVDDATIIEIPTDYKEWIEKDVEGGLREFAGIVVGSRMPAIPYRENIAKGVENFNAITGGAQLFRVPEIEIQRLWVPGEDPDWGRLINYDYLKKVILDKHTMFAGHLDPALKHDKGGLAVGHVVGWTLMPAIKKYNPRKRIHEEKRAPQAPMIMIDGILRIVAPPGEEIDLEMLQNLVIHLKEIMRLEYFSVDSWQSAQMIQAWLKADIVAGNVSVDDTPEPYTRVRLGYRDARIYTPDHDTYRGEIIDLIYDNKKFDHPPAGSKDCSDAVAGTVYLLETHLANYIPYRPGSDKSAVEPRAGERRGRRVGRRKRV